MRTVPAVLLFTLTAATLSAGEARLTAKPAAVRKDGKVTISFTVSAPTDVEVAVLDAKGRVARHLAAGVLGGKNPPPPPLKTGLSQALEWNMRDDFGKPAQGGPFKVRVRVGMSVKFGRIFGTSPYSGVLSSGAPSDSVAVAPDGGIYVKMASLVPQLHAAMPWQIRKFDKTGTYVRTVLPYPPSTPPAKTPGFRLIDAGDGQMTPAHTNPLDVVLFNFGDNVHNRIVDNNLIFIDNRGARLTFFKVDGSNALKVVPMRTSPAALKWAKWLSPQVAFSPDGKYAYYSNVANTPYDGKDPAKFDTKFPQGRVYRQDLGKPGSNPEKFYDLVLPDWKEQKYWLPSAWDKKTAAAGIAVDAKGHVFVCDLVNQEVVELSPKGEKLGATKVPWPDKVLVNSKTGTLYVVSCKVSRGHRPPASLLKITGRGAGAKVVAKLPLKGALGHSLALDDSGAAPVLWLGGGGQLVRVEDRGAQLAAVGGNLVNRDETAISFVCFGDVDTEAELVYITNGMGPVWCYDGKTGKGRVMPFKACDVAIGPGGMIYGWGTSGSWSGPVARYHRGGKPAPLPATGKHTYGNVFGRYGRGNNAPGLDVDWQGRVYATCGFNDCHVRVYGNDGKLVNYDRKITVGKGDKKREIPVFLSYVMDQGGNVRLDPAGNAYVLEIGLPKGFTPPKGFEKEPAYTRCSGTIYKFPPEGGKFKKAGRGWEAEGAVASYTVPCGPISGSWASTISVCHCMRPRYDVDAYGRLYVPHGVTYKVTLVDNADNQILKFGAYGNYDAQGPKSSEPKPEIPLGWPIFAGASDKHIYVGDGLNHRVVRTDKTWAAEETCEVK
ncbi:MAG: hypothetical protein ACYTGB_09835 [Planctomycetota bacterium]|jgi:DNA-binding beta-propeller fold protein YncE